MPRGPRLINDKCLICSNDKKSKRSNVLCDVHYKIILEKVEKLLDYYNSDFTALLSAFVDIGIKKNYSSYEEIKELIAKRLNITFFSQSTSTSKVNITQALKRFCRDKFKENPTKYEKPPKNSSSKQDFVLWANKNNIDLTHFKTRSYTKRNDSIDEYTNSFSPNYSCDSSETDKCSEDGNSKDEYDYHNNAVDSKLKSEYSVGKYTNSNMYSIIPFNEFQFQPPYHKINLYFHGMAPPFYPPNMQFKGYSIPQMIGHPNVEQSVAHTLSRIF